MLTPHALKNREAWTRYSADYVEAGRKAWARTEPDWGMFAIPESEVGALGDLSWYQGKDTIELGCGTAYFSSWLYRLGARPVGIDVTPAQLESARAFQKEFGIEFPLMEASAEHVPLTDAGFDLAFSEYGASIWCDPEIWIPEAARLLRPGGRLIFLRNSPLSMLCSEPNGAVGTKLARPWSDLQRIEEDGAVEFHMPHGEVIRLLRASGFDVEDLIELLVPHEATTRYDWLTAEWAHRWPCEEIWRATKLTK